MLGLQKAYKKILNKDRSAWQQTGLRAFYSKEDTFDEEQVPDKLGYCWGSICCDYVIGHG
jgi:hypothetical protein